MENDFVREKDIGHGKGNTPLVEELHTLAVVVDNLDERGNGLLVVVIFVVVVVIVNTVFLPRGNVVEGRTYILHDWDPSFRVYSLLQGLSDVVVSDQLILRDRVENVTDRGKKSEKVEL
jgi:hypothetical protein